MYRRALAIREAALGPDHPDVAKSLGNLAILLNDKGDYAAAEPLYRRALAVKEATLGLDHPSVANTCYNLSGFYSQHGTDHAVAEVFARRAVTIWEAVLGARHPDTIDAMKRLAQCLSVLGRHEEARALGERTTVLRDDIEISDDSEV